MDDAGQYLDGMGGEHYFITMSDGFEYAVATHFQISRNGRRRMEPLKPNP